MTATPALQSAFVWLDVIVDQPARPNFDAERRSMGRQSYSAAVSRIIQIRSSRPAILHGQCFSEGRGRHASRWQHEIAGVVRAGRAANMRGARHRRRRMTSTTCRSRRRGIHESMVRDPARMRGQRPDLRLVRSPRFETGRGKISRYFAIGREGRDGRRRAAVALRSAGDCADAATLWASVGIRSARARR